MIGNSINKICCDSVTLIENYDLAIADTENIWECHHRLETHFSNGDKRPMNAIISRNELIALNMYYNRPASELIFLTKAEHNNLHHAKKIVSVESRNKMSVAKKGTIFVPWNKGKTNVYTEEQLKRMSDARKGKKLSEESKKNIVNAVIKRYEERRKLGLPLIPNAYKPTEEDKLKASKRAKKNISKVVDAYHKQTELSWNEFQKYYKEHLQEVDQL